MSRNIKTIRFIIIALICCFSLVACGSSKTYEEALAAKENGDFETALQLFEGIKEYNDSTEQIKEINNTIAYNDALVAREEYDYERAIELLKKITGFKDSDTLLDDIEDEAFQDSMATYIFNMIRDGGFYNPSAVRILKGGYNTPENGDIFATYLETK